MSEHTPGPWEVIGGPVSGTWHVAAAYDWGGHIAAIEACKEEEANARLIAAAPELLDALRIARHYVAIAAEGTSGRNVYQDLATVERAITEAEGREP